MPEITQLDIQRAPASAAPVPGTRSWNVHRGGSAVLLRWLEAQLGLGAGEPSFAQRVGEYATALDAVPDATFGPSLRADRWATAEELLRRREELRLAGWDELDRPGLPPLVRDMARAVSARVLRFPDEAGRLLCISAAMDQGQTLPRHRCVLCDSMDRWPPLWRVVLGRLTTEQASGLTPLARPTTSLAVIQWLVLGGDMIPVHTDGSLRWLESRSVHAACEAVAAALASDTACVPDTVICCERSEVALCLDGALARAGLPTMGASLRTLCHPALQVLPIVLRLCWEPVDPTILLDFLTLPIGPLPRRAASRLAQALAEQPGLGSRAWEEAFDELTSKEENHDGTLGTLLRTWLSAERVRWGDPLPAALVEDRCRRVAQWAAGRAAGLDGDAEAKPSDTTMAAALRLAAGQAADLAALASAEGSPLFEPQLSRLVEAALGEAAEAQPHRAASGGPRLVRSLAEITAPCARLVWLGLGTEDQAPSRWTAQELAQLWTAGIGLDEESARLASLREGERRGLSRVRESLLCIAIPGDEEQRPHPLWLLAKASLEASGEKHPLPSRNSSSPEPAPWLPGASLRPGRPFPPTLARVRPGAFRPRSCETGIGPRPPTSRCAWAARLSGS